MSKSEGEIKVATREETEFVIQNMRAQDRREVMDSHGVFGLNLLRDAADWGDARVGKVGDDILCLFGVTPMTIVGGGGIPWMISTDAIRKHARIFLPRSKQWVDEQLEEYGYLTNYVDERNTVAKRWLKWLGFTLAEPVPYGLRKLPFHKFEMGER